MGHLVITLSASTTFPSGGTPIFGQSTPAQGTIPAPGAHIPGPWNSGQGFVPSSRMSFWGNSFHSQWNPGQTSMPLPSGPAWGNPSQSPSNTMNAQHPMSFMGNQPMMSPQMQNPYAVRAMVSTRTRASSQTFPGNLVPVKL
jgi:hypothetical protein